MTEKAVVPQAQQAAAAAMDEAIGFGARGAEITTLAQAARLAVWAHASGMYKKFKNKEQIVMALQFGAELGFSPMQSLKAVHMIDDHPSLEVEAQAAKVEADGALKEGTKIRYRFEGEGEDLACIAWSWPRGGEKLESEPVYLREFKHLRQRANWVNYPRRMIKARAVGYHLRDYYASVLHNVASAEELMDLHAERGEPPVERDITPPKGVDPLLASVVPEGKPMSFATPHPADESETVVEPTAESVECDHEWVVERAPDADPLWCCRLCGVVRGDQQ
jgi:hypothetical protein